MEDYSEATMETEFEGSEGDLSIEQLIFMGRWKPAFIDYRAIGLNSDFPRWILETASDAETKVEEMMTVIADIIESLIEDDYLSEDEQQDIEEIYEEQIRMTAEEFAERNTRLITYGESAYFWVCGGCYLFKTTGNSDAETDYSRIEYTREGEYSEWHNDIFTPHLYDFAFNMLYSMAVFVRTGEVR